MLFWKIWMRLFNRGAPELLTAADLSVGQTLQSATASYSILEFIGEGSFGKVAKCQNMSTQEIVAIKMLKDREAIKDADKEVSMLELLRVLDSTKANLVQFYERFEHQGLTCLTFEMLDISLLDAVRDRGFKPLAPRELRPIAQQLLVALDALKSMKILHTDIKPDNIMLTDLQNEPLRVKLIDFGLARPLSQVKAGTWMQPVGFRAPEVTLGIPFNEAIDVWGVGCTLAFLYLGRELFPYTCIYQMMKRMLEILGYPEQYLLWRGCYTHHFFGLSTLCWKLRTPQEYAALTKITPELNSPYDSINSLDDLVNTHTKIRAAEHEDRKAFVELLKGLLAFDGSMRLTPRRALEHPFITMSHLSTVPYSDDYTLISSAFMAVCPTPDTPKDEDLLSVEQPEQTWPTHLEENFNAFFMKEKANDTPKNAAQLNMPWIQTETTTLEETGPTNSNPATERPTQDETSHNGSSGDGHPDSGVCSSPIQGPVAEDQSLAAGDTGASAASIKTEATALQSKDKPCAASRPEEAQAPDSGFCAAQTSSHDVVPLTSSANMVMVPEASSLCADVIEKEQVASPSETSAKSSTGLRGVRRFLRRVLRPFSCCVRPSVDH